MLNGNLVKTDFPSVLMGIFEKGLTGELILENGNIKKSVFFLKGYPVFAKSNASEDKIGKVILESGKINKEDLEKALKIARKSGKKIGYVLVKMNILSPGELYELVIKQVRKIIYSLFTWEAGKFSFMEKTSIPKEVITLEDNPAHMIFRGITNYYSEEMLLKRIGNLNIIYKRIKSPYFSLDSLPVDSDDITILKSVDGEKSLKGIIQKLPFPRKKILASIYAFSILKFLETVEVAEDEEALYQESRLEEILNNFEKTSLFQWLGITPESTKEEVIEAYSRLSKRFRKEFLPAFISSKAASLCESIYNHLTEAYNLLIDDSLRDFYAQLIESGIDTSKAKKLLMKKYAKVLFEEGKELYKEGKIHEAHKKFMLAIKYDPENGDYYTAVALTDLTDYEGYEPDFDEAEKMLKEAISRQMHQPRNYFYLGQMYKHLGNFILAKKFLKQALEVDPNYLYAKKALEEVKQLEKRAKK